MNAPCLSLALSGCRRFPALIHDCFLPAQVSNDFLVHGGTEAACMSTSSDVSVVAGYANSDRPLLFRIKVDTPMDMGAAIDWLSCFPHEQEILYPPYCYLQAMFKQPIYGKSVGEVITLKVSFPS